MSHPTLHRIGAFLMRVNALTFVLIAFTLAIEEKPVAMIGAGLIAVSCWWSAQ